MIRRDEITAVGTFAKPHGIKGEVAAVIDSGVDVAGLSCIVVEVDNIFVPFFIDSVRPKGVTTDLLTIAGINDGNAASEFTNKTIYALKSEIADDVPDGGFYIGSVIGYTLNDAAGARVGVIEDVDLSSENMLLIVRLDGSERTAYVPVAEELVLGMDADDRVLTLAIADGLLDLNS